MASLEVRTLASKAVTYRVIWLQAGQKQRERFRTHGEAIAFRREVEAGGNVWPADWIPGVGRTGAVRVAAPVVAVKAAPVHTMTVAAMCDAHTRSDATEGDDNYRLRMRRNFAAHLGDLAQRDAATVTRVDVQAWIDAKRAVRAFKTVKNVRSELSAAFAYGLREGIVDVNPVKATRIEKATAAERKAAKPVFLNHAEFELLRQAVADIDPTSGDYVTALARTGMRSGEMRALVPANVDLAGGYIHVCEAIKWASDGKHTLGEPKTENGNRTIKIDAVVVEILARHMMGKPADEPIWLLGNDGTWQRNVWTKARASVADQLGAKARVRIHDLRHCLASWLLASGAVSLLEVSRHLGHADISTTSKTYAHVDPTVSNIGAVMASW